LKPEHEGTVADFGLPGGDWPGANQVHVFSSLKKTKVVTGLPFRLKW
jgi:hypothetical protein